MSSSTMSSTMIKLMSSDGKIFDVEEKVARMSEIVNTLLQQLGNTDDEPVPLPKVKAPILELVLKWADQHKDKIVKDYEDDEAQVGRSHEIPEWDAEFFKIMDNGTIFQIIEAANYMDMKPLLDMAGEVVANQLRGKTREQIRMQFNIENDFTDDEYELIQKADKWTEDFDDDEEEKK